MKLTYRGVSYDYNPVSIETTEAEVAGKYRSRDWRFRNLKKPPVLVPTANLTYRGVAYHQQETIPSVKPVEVPVISTEAKARALMFNHSKTIKKRQQSLLSRAATTIGLSASEASHYWNRIQGKIHPTFRANYDRMGATMS
jgi:hypothetical protein